ncbi:MAG: tyrosine-type recombinase/integrase [Anaerolineae bacterium]
MAKKQLPLFSSQPTTAEEISKQTPVGATLDLFRKYLTHEGKSEHTVKAFIGDMELLCEYTGEQTPIGQYKTSTLNDYLDWMENRRGVSCSRKTYARRVTTLKVYFKWLKQVDAIPHDPALAILQRSGPAPLSHVLSPQQVDAVLAVASQQKRGDEQDYRPEFLFRLLLLTGIKKSEAGRLMLNDFDTDNAQYPSVLIRHRTRNVYKERRIDVPPELVDLLRDYQEEYQLKDEVFTCTTRNLEYILTDLGKDAGVPFKLSFEVMRWTMGVRDWRSGGDENAIREKMGLSQASWYETSNKIKRLIARQIASEAHAPIDD